MVNFHYHSLTPVLKSAIKTKSQHRNMAILAFDFLNTL